MKKKRIVLLTVLAAVVLGFLYFEGYTFHTTAGYFKHLYGSAAVRKNDDGWEKLDLRYLDLGVPKDSLEKLSDIPNAFIPLLPLTEQVETLLQNHSDQFTVKMEVSELVWNNRFIQPGKPGSSPHYAVKYTITNCGAEPFLVNRYPVLYQKIGGEWYCLGLNSKQYHSHAFENYELAPGERKKLIFYLENKYQRWRLPKGEVCLVFFGGPNNSESVAIPFTLT